MDKFLADCMLGRLARWLRVMGYDTLWLDRDPGPDLAGLAARQGRLLLTRRTAYRRVCGVFITPDRVEGQLRQVVKARGLDTQSHRFTLCLVCNHPLEILDPALARLRVPPYVAATGQSFNHCPACDRVYWAGSHRRRMEDALERMLNPLEEE